LLLLRYCHLLCSVLLLSSLSVHPLLLFFLLLTPRPPSPTLFPYTTLFRSSAACGPSPRAFRSATTFSAAPSFPITRATSRPALQDRKSTRLNSSHQIISYAVFCLKKKKK